MGICDCLAAIFIPADGVQWALWVLRGSVGGRVRAKVAESRGVGCVVRWQVWWFPGLGLSSRAHHNY